ncbi:MAG: acyl-CoA thioesterase [Myxococcales bacterium]|nr:acyl-CoA thioesterase [Myxococcales bacterium]MCB9754132.1 acyl-CoA thioesterase [Myxococcales bacterium]
MRFHEVVHGVYFDDLDAFQILHNARYLLLFEHAIGSFWRRLGWADRLDFNSHPDQFHLVRANHIEYLRPVTGTGEVRVRVWVKRLGRSSLSFGLRVLPMDEDVDHATGERVVVRVHPTTRAPEPWTESFREILAPFREDLTPGEEP